MILAQGPRRFLPPGHGPRGEDPEWLKHMNHYEQHKNDYPITGDAKVQWFKPFVLKFELEIIFNVPISENPSSEELATCRSNIWNQIDEDVKDLTIREFVEKYDDPYSSHTLDGMVRKRGWSNWMDRLHLQGRAEWKLYSAQCLSCGDIQDLELMPLTDKLDYWVCRKCGQLHSHIRPGMPGS